MFRSAAGRIRRAEKIVFVTGAGISQESGIPTFRGRDGLWRKHDAMKLATIDAFFDNPRLVWEWYNERRANIFAAEPNQGHYAIVGFESIADTVVLTQNIDGLHQRAASTNVLELHGNIIRIKCMACGFKETAERVLDSLPICKCGNIKRPDVVWFGEALQQDLWQRAIEHAGQCGIMVVVGTSLAVYPANTLPIYARHNDALLVEVNPEDTAMSDDMDLTVRGTAARLLPEMLSVFRQLRAGY